MADQDCSPVRARATTGAAPDRRKVAERRGSDSQWRRDSGAGAGKERSNVHTLLATQRQVGSTGFGNALTKMGRLVELQLLFSRHPSRSHSTVGRLPICYGDGRWELAPGARLEIPAVTFPFKEVAAPTTPAAEAFRTLATAWAMATRRRQSLIPCRELEEL